MSTDFLNRRMDLKHTSLSSENHLTMDTSYPVKLAGKVVKIFIASSDFNTDKWILENSVKDIILTIENDSVYDFAGRVIKNNIGEDKAYPSNTNVFKNDDYVMAIIDFDNKKIFLCSQTNFSVFITGNTGDECKFKLFDITGESEMPGYEYNINEEVFDLAVEFENEEGSHSFVRHGKDDIVYEIPTNQDGTRNMNPVAKVDTIDINSLNVSVQNLIFPFINLINSDIGFEGITAIHSFRTINGSVNDKFIDEFCFTNEELKKLPIYNAEEDRYFFSEYVNIEDDKKSNYYYVFSADRNTNQINTSVSGDDMIFNPISISNKKFSSFYNFINNGIKVGDKSVGISAKYKASDYIGNWWGNDNQVGYCCYNYDGDYKKIIIEKFLYDIDYPYDVFVRKNRTDLGSANISYTFDDTIKNTIFDNSEMSIVKRFIEFFASDSTYENHIKDRILRMSNDTNIGFVLFRDENSILYDKTLKNIITIYPEVFENVLFDKDSQGNFSHNAENLHNFTSFYNDTVPDTDFNRKKYISDQHILSDRYNLDYIIYYLLNRNSNSGYYGTSYDSNIYKLNIADIGENNLKMNISSPILGSDGSNQCITTDVNGNYVMIDILTNVNATNINYPYESDNKDYLNAQIGIQNIVLTRKIKFANEYINYENGQYNIYPDGFGEGKESTQLFIAITTNNTDVYMQGVSTDNFKNNSAIGSTVTGMMYMYYVYNNKIYRIKYYYKDNDTDSNSSNNYISNFDYFSDSEIVNIDTTYSRTEYGSYMTKAYLNQYIANNNSTLDEAISQLNSILQGETPMKIITDVIEAYKFYPLNTEDSQSCNISYYNADVDDKPINTCNLSLTFDCERYFAASINDSSINNGSGFRLKDLIDDDFVIYQNHLAPHLSNTQVDGRYIYDIKSYNDYLKSKKVSDVFYTEEFPYLNGIGIREEYYVEKTLYDFYNYILTRDLSKPISSPDSLLTSNSSFNTSNKLYFNKEQVKKIKNVKNVYNEELEKYEALFLDDNSNPVNIESQIALRNNININSIFGLNNSTLVDSNGKDISYLYESEDSIYVNKEETGKKSVYSISINDGNADNAVILSINGTIGNIEVDKLAWESLLLALCNNKSIDILSKSLLQIKTELNDYVRLTGQNINDLVSIEDNISDEDANKHDTIFDILPDDNDETKEYKQTHYKEHNAEFDEKHNLYKFNFGYGFNDDVRKLNNRGIIVFMSDGADTKCNRNGSLDVNPENFEYNFKEGKIYPKRMYISKDGLICTKEYYDKELNETNDYQSQIDELQRQINALKIKVGDVYANLMQSVWKFNDVVNLSIDMKDGDTTNEQVTALRGQNSTLRDTTYDDISSVANAIYSYNDTVYNYINSIKTSIEYLNTLQTCNNRIKSSTSNDSLITNIKAYNTELINYLFDIEWISDKETVQYYNNIISI